MPRLFEAHQIRRTTSLDGLWDFVPDPESKGERAGWWKSFPARSERMSVPGCWDTLPEYYDYKAKAWYRRRFHVPAECHLQLSFEGIGGASRVWLDGRPLGESPLAVTPFDLLRRHVAAGGHEVIVEVDNSKDRKKVFPNYGGDWFHYGGIVRTVEAAFLGPVRIRSMCLHYAIVGSRVRLAPEVFIENLSDNVRREELTLELNGIELARVPVNLPAGKVALVRCSLPPTALALWSPEAPNLHLFQASCGGDDRIERTGFRAIALRQKRILINGKPTKLLGVNRHDEYGDGGFAVPPDILLRDFRLIRNLGCNAVRCHYPISPLAMDLCDELGLLVWSEVPFYARWPEVVEDADYLALAEQAIERMIRRDCNRPSVFVWSVMNECATDIPAGVRAARRLVRKVRSLDPNRPVSYATNKLLDDRGYRLLDIAGLNSYPGWYDEKRFRPWPEVIPQMRRKLRREGKDDMPILVTETGAAGLYGDRSFEDRKWSEPFQARMLGQHLEYLLKEKEVAGVFLWQFADVRTIREYWSNRPGTFNNKGLVDRFRRPKEAYWKVRDLYQQFRGDHPSRQKES